MSKKNKIKISWFSSYFSLNPLSKLNCLFLTMEEQTSCPAGVAQWLNIEPRTKRSLSFDF